MISLYHGDCFNILEELNRENVKVDAVICDPPYNIDYADWDTKFDIVSALELSIQLMKDDANLVLFQGYSNVCQVKEFLDNKMKFRNWIIWDRLKGRGGSRNLVSTREDILWYSKSENYTFNKLYSNTLKASRGKGLGGKNGQQFRALTNVWYDISPLPPWSPERTEHPTQKPLKLMERCIQLWTNSGDLVLDFTMGSGTTGVACKNLNRSFIGIESDEQWFSVSKSRINSRIAKKFFSIEN